VLIVRTDTIPGLVWSGLPDGTFDFINQPWLTYLGCTWEELTARGGLRSVVHPDDVEHADARWLATRSSGKHIDHELRMRRADGQYRWFLTRAMPLHDEQGNIVRWYGTATDIDDRKRADEARQVVSVSDSGVGLPPQQTDQIFEAFFTTKDHGIGMGLSISRTIVESHGGRLWAADHTLSGANFCFTLPAKV